MATRANCQLSWQKKNTVWLALGAREGNGTPLARVRGESEDGDKGNKHSRLKRGVGGTSGLSRHKSHDVVCGGTKATQNGRRYVRA